MSGKGKKKKKGKVIKKINVINAKPRLNHGRYYRVRRKMGRYQGNGIGYQKRDQQKTWVKMGHPPRK